MEIKESQTALAKAFKKRITGVAFEGAQHKAAGSRAEFSFPDETEAILAYATVKRDLPKGQFAVYSIVSVKGGPIYRVMSETHLDKSGTFFGNGLFTATSHSLLEPGDYYVRNTKEIDGVAEKIVADMEKVFVPIITAFTADYKRAFDFVLRNEGRYVRNPFTLCVIILGMSGSFDRVGSLIAEAGKHDGFYDFRKAGDVHTEIVDPIVEWFSKNSL